MKYDIVVYSSAEQGVHLAAQALENLGECLKDMHLIFCGSENENLHSLNRKAGKISFCPESESSAQSLNRAAKLAQTDYILFLNGGRRLCPDSIRRLEQTVGKYPEAVGFGLAVSPVESGVHYDPVDLTVSYISFNCALVKKRRFVQCGGFDASFDVWKDVDISWRLRRLGPLKYCPGASVAYEKTEDEKRLYIRGGYERLLLARKFGTKGTAAKRIKDYIQMIKTPRHFPSVRKELAALLAGYFLKAPVMAAFNRKNGSLYKEIADFQPGFAPRRGQVHCGRPAENPLVSVVVRTHRRKEVLKRTLSCLYNQTYKNFEVIVVEDGQDTAGEMVKSDFTGLNIRYFSTGKNVGRGKAGNTGIEMAKGEYVCFLDDDDYLYADYIAAHLYCFEQNPEADLIISSTMAAKGEVKSRRPYVFDVSEYFPVIFDHITLMDMCVKCRVPISGAMFRRRMYEICGGMREDMDGDEDWFMWLKFMARGKRADSFCCDIPRALSLCIYPADEKQARRREARYRTYDRQMLYGKNLAFTVNSSEIHRWEEYVKADIRHLKNTGRLESFMQNLSPLGCRKLEYTPGKNTLTAGQINSYYYYLVKLSAGQI